MLPLPEYKTRNLLAGEGVSIIDGLFIPSDSNATYSLPNPPVYLKVQVPGITSRAAQGLVRRSDSREQMEKDFDELLSIKTDKGKSEGVLITKAVKIVAEYYAACMLDLGSDQAAPGGMLLFSAEGGSGVEERSEKLKKIPFSLLTPPSSDEISEFLNDVNNPKAIASFLEKVVKTFIRYRLIVLEINPIGVLENGEILVVDCRAEFEKNAVAKKDQEAFGDLSQGDHDLTSFERLVEKINEQDSAGTGFVRENRDSAPLGAYRVATNLCGGGGKMLWDMTTGSRKDIYSVNESDTSGGLSAFKSYRILRAILGLENAQVLLLTGSGMAFQDQFHLAAAVWKALRESPTPLPALLRFGGTEEDKAQKLIDRVAPSLPVKIRRFESHVFPNAMVEEIADIVSEERMQVTPPSPPEGEPVFSVKIPPGDFYFYPDKWSGSDDPPCIRVCPTKFLVWNKKTRSIEPAKDTRCIGCLMCETVSLLDGNGELRINLEIPEV